MKHSPDRHPAGDENKQTNTETKTKETKETNKQTKKQYGFHDYDM